MDISIIALLGFIMAGYSVIANDSVQTLGTFMVSNQKLKWYFLWIFASTILVGTVFWSWAHYGGDISFGRLEKIPFQEPQWYHLLAPIALIGLTRFGIPASTSLLILASFSSVLIFEKILIKSLSGYAIAATSAFFLWCLGQKLFPKIEKYLPKSQNFWRGTQWFATGFLWFSWLSHDIANTAIFLPRKLSLTHLIFVLLFFVVALGWIFWKKGGRIQEIVLNKTNVTYMRSATMIDSVYAVVLIFFKELNSIPMSTTWVFVGLLAGREAAITFSQQKTDGSKGLFPLIGKDLYKVFLGLIISLLMIFFVQFLQS